MDFIHYRSIIHRDLKPENILINSKYDGAYDLRIADFGFAVSLENPNHKLNKCGTPGYVAPEVLRDKTYN